MLILVLMPHGTCTSDSCKEEEVVVVLLIGEDEEVEQPSTKQL